MVIQFVKLEGLYGYVSVIVHPTCNLHHRFLGLGRLAFAMSRLPNNLTAGYDKYRYAICALKDAVDCNRYLIDGNERFKSQKQCPSSSCLVVDNNLTDVGL